MVDVVGRNGSAALGLGDRVRPTRPVDAVEVDGIAAGVQLAQRDAVVARRAPRHQRPADHPRARIPEPVQRQAYRDDTEKNMMPFSTMWAYTELFKMPTIVRELGLGYTIIYRIPFQRDL